MQTQTQTLLVEIRCEELPPAQVYALAESFPEQLHAALEKKGFVDFVKVSSYAPLATPRRFAALLQGIRSHAATSQVRRKGPPVDNCYDEKQQPTPALQGFMKSVGVESTDQLEEMEEKGRKYIAFDETRGGNALADALADIVQEVLLGINAPRLMRWGDNEFKFIRPLRGVLMLHGSDVLDGTVLGITATATTRGHPTLANEDITVENAEEYVDTLEKKGAVIADIDVRRDEIEKQLDKNMGILPDLLKEVTALCENPTVYNGTLDEEFLQLPPFCVKECMTIHQRAFPVYDTEGLTTTYQFVADNHPKDPAALINGMNTVLRARLRDVEFYIEEDKKLTLSDALDKLNSIVYHRKLGSQRERVTRLEKIANLIGKRLDLDETSHDHLLQAAKICKSDLSTFIIGEYPELEGDIAATYFCNDQPDEVKKLVSEHNHPIKKLNSPDFFFTIGNLVAMHGNSPHEIENTFPTHRALWLTLSLEKLIGLFAVGEKPSGSKDPHGLRGAAGVAATHLELSERKLALDNLLTDIAAEFSDLPAHDITVVRDFIVERKRQQILEQNVAAAATILNAVLATPPVYLVEVGEKCAALDDFLNQQKETAESLIEANKRINNILRKSNAADLPAVDETLLQDDAERALYKQLTSCKEANAKALETYDYKKVLENTAALRDDVDNFFDKVLVNAEDEKLRANRLALLAALRDVFNTVGDLAKLSGG